MRLDPATSGLHSPLPASLASLATRHNPELTRSRPPVAAASLQSLRAFPNSIPYAASKSGVLGLTRALAEAYSPAYGYDGITCNAIAPGYVKTELTAAVFADEERAERLAARTLIGRNSVPEDLVGTAIFLCSEASAYVNAQTLYVDGGFTALGER